ncbi:hypothetical protein PS1_023177 [Malus domestica]
MSRLSTSVARPTIPPTLSMMSEVTTAAQRSTKSTSTTKISLSLKSRLASKSSTSQRAYDTKSSTGKLELAPLFLKFCVLGSLSGDTLALIIFLLTIILVLIILTVTRKVVGILHPNQDLKKIMIIIARKCTSKSPPFPLSSQLKMAKHLYLITEGKFMRFHIGISSD